MIGSPENNFNTMQNQKPSSQRYGDALQQFRQRDTDPGDVNYTGQNNGFYGRGYNQNYYNPRMSTAQSYNKFGTPTPPMMMQPQSNASYNLQPQIHSNQNNSQGPMSIGQTSPYGVGLAAPQSSTVQSSIVNGTSNKPTPQQLFQAVMKKTNNNPFGW